MQAAAVAAQVDDLGAVAAAMGDVQCGTDAHEGQSVRNPVQAVTTALQGMRKETTHMKTQIGFLQHRLKMCTR